MLTIDQQSALDKMLKWFTEKSKPYFVLSGYAGTGKTYLIEKFAFEHLRLESNQVAFCTPTGKAATVLIQNGVLRASTIHRLIYTPKKVLVEREVNGKVETVEEVKFVKKEFIDHNLKLIIVDEISMVSKKIFDDLLSFNIKILCTGDSAQLPPVNAESMNLLDSPDAQLTQIIRQKEGSKIIEIADMVRRGQRLDYGDYGEVEVLERSKLTDEQIIDMMLEVDQVLCGKNVTRNALNDVYRQSIGIFSKLPQKGEKLICVNNNWSIALDENMDYYLVNGMTGYIEDTMKESNAKIEKIGFKADFLEEYKRDLLVDKGIFDIGEFYYERGKKIGGFKDFDVVNRFEFGYAISVHKSQGSQFGSILIFDESRVFGDSRHRWLYTAITRAKNKVIIIR